MSELRRRGCRPAFGCPRRQPPGPDSRDARRGFQPLVREAARAKVLAQAVTGLARATGSVAAPTKFVLIWRGEPWLELGLEGDRVVILPGWGFRAASEGGRWRAGACSAEAWPGSARPGRPSRVAPNRRAIGQARFEGRALSCREGPFAVGLFPSSRNDVPSAPVIGSPEIPRPGEPRIDRFGFDPAQPLDRIQRIPQAKSQAGVDGGRHCCRAAGLAHPRRKAMNSPGRGKTCVRGGVAPESPDHLSRPVARSTCSPSPAAWIRIESTGAGSP